MATLATLSPLGDGVPVVVAARELPAGTVLTAEDICVVEIPQQVLPDGWRELPDEVIGATTTGPMTRGTVLTSAATRTGPGPGDGRVVVPFRVNDASTASLIRVGDLITVVGSSPDGSVVELASRVEVTALPSPDESWGSSTGALIAVACDPSTGAQLAAAAGQMSLGIVLG